MAECSLSTGIISAPVLFAADIMTSPAHTRLSLLARASVFPQDTVSKLYAYPAKPPTALKHMSASSQQNTSRMPSSGRDSSVPQYAGVNSASRASYSGEDLCATRDTISYCSGYLRTTSRTCRPMLPQHPARAMPFFTLPLLAPPRAHARCATSSLVMSSLVMSSLLCISCLCADAPHSCLCALCTYTIRFLRACACPA